MTDQAPTPAPYMQAMGPDVAALARDYEQAQLALKALTEHKDTIAVQLKAACEAAAFSAGYGPDSAVVLEGDRYAVRVTPVQTWRLDSKRLKAEQAPLYAAYAKMSTSLRLTVDTA